MYIITTKISNTLKINKIIFLTSNWQEYEKKILFSNVLTDSQSS